MGTLEIDPGSHANPGPTSFLIPCRLVCWHCHRLLFTGKVEVDPDGAVVVSVSPCPCIAERKGIGSELPEKERR